MWMVSNLLYSTIIFIGGNVPDDCLNTVVSVAVISESSFEISWLEIKKSGVDSFASKKWRSELKKKNPTYSCFILNCLQALTFQPVLQFEYYCNAWGRFEQ